MIDDEDIDSSSKPIFRDTGDVVEVFIVIPAIGL